MCNEHQQHLNPRQVNGNVGQCLAKRCLKEGFYDFLSQRVEILSGLESFEKLDAGYPESNEDS